MSLYLSFFLLLLLLSRSLAENRTLIDMHSHLLVDWGVQLADISLYCGTCCGRFGTLSYAHTHAHAYTDGGTLVHLRARTHMHAQAHTHTYFLSSFDDVYGIELPAINFFFRREGSLREIL